MLIAYGDVVIIDGKPETDLTERACRQPDKNRSVGNAVVHPAYESMITSPFECRWFKH